MLHSKMTTLLTSSLLTFAAAGLTGCLEHPLKEVEYEGVIERPGPVTIEGNREVDVLFVIDNSGSMAEEQALLAANFEAFIDELDAVDANYRIGIITTDNGNPRYPKAVFEGGELRLSSCLDRLSPDGVSGGDFIFGDFNAEFACSDHCTLTNEEIALRPSAGKLESEELLPRRWLENIDGGTNLSADVSLAQAFQCFGPQGINGSGFEAPLESMYRALLGADDSESANFGFLRENAHLAVIFITDEVDCSFNPDFTEIFQDNTTFWSDPEGQIPTSAVCWNAGTKCQGPGPVYEGCEPADYGIDGGAAATENDAVMLPLARYVDLLTEIQELNEGRKVMVAAIAGVPVGYGEGAPIPYAQSSDPAEQNEFGIGAGCSFNLDDGDPSNDSVARPPVRLRELASAFPIDAEGGAGLYSICQDDYSGPLADIGAQIKAQLRPACFSGCLLDTDPQTDLLEPRCTFTQTTADGEKTNLQPCRAEAGEWVVPAGENVCYAFLVDQGGQSAESLDDMSIDEETGKTYCADQGNAELKIVRSAPPPSGAKIDAVCSVEPHAEDACPNIVG